MTTSPDRMPPLTADQMTPAQREVAQELIAGRRGALYGPFVPALRSPELTRRLQKVGEYLRYEPALPPKLRELAIIMVAREWTQEFEWDVHAPLAEREGLARETIDDIAARRRPARMAADEALVHDFIVELQRTRTIGDETYAAAIALLQEQGVIDLLALTGYYTTLAMIMNVARTALPDGKTPVLSAIPR